MFVFEFDFEHGVGQRLKNRCHHLNRVFFAHALLDFFVARVLRYAQDFGSGLPLRSRPLNASTLLIDSFKFASSCSSYCVKITGPSFVTATQCSKCALQLPSAVTAVHLSSNTLAPGLPKFTIGSIARTMPSRSRAPCPRAPKFGTCGSSWSLVPMPCPTNSRTTLKPLASKNSCTAAPTSPTALPTRACSMPLYNEASVTSSSLRTSGLTESSTGTVIAASP